MTGLSDSNWLAYRSISAFLGAVTQDTASRGASGASLQLGWRERVQGSDEAVDGFFPLRLRKRNIHLASAVDPVSLHWLPSPPPRPRSPKRAAPHQA